MTCPAYPSVDWTKRSVSPTLCKFPFINSTFDKEEKKKKNQLQGFTVDYENRILRRPKVAAVYTTMVTAIMEKQKEGIFSLKLELI